MGRTFLLQLFQELGHLLRMFSPSILGAPQAFICQVHHFNGEVRLSTSILDLGGELLFFPSELKQSVPVLSEDRLGPSKVDKVGEEGLHRSGLLTTELDRRSKERFIKSFLGEQPHTIPVACLERLLGELPEALLGPDLVQKWT